jgi:Bacterial protein of unknown function (DUF839)
MKRMLTLGAAVAVAAALAAVALAGDNTSGFKTSHSSMLTGVAPGSTVTQIITVGDTMPGGYRFESIPDGIALKARGNGRLDVYVNHETSTVPFPYNAGAAPEANQNDFDNSQVSLLALNQHSAGVLNAKFVIESSENFQRFCSNYLATAAEGFDRELLFTNEEATDFVFRTGTAWPAPTTDPPAEQAGLVVAYDVRTGKHKPIYGMGRHNHENSVPVPGFDELVVLSGDDTFTSDPAQSQLYAYIADDADAIWNDEGQLYGFKVQGKSNYYDVPVGSTASYPGEFVPIDKTAAQGDQTALENASDAAGVFQFVRVEDIAYDKRPGKSRVVYFADSGRGSDSAGANAFASRNGRIWKLEFTDPDDPTQATLSLVVEGDDNPVKTPTEIHQPDNLETTAAGSLMVTEDPGSSQQFPAGSDDPSSPNFDPRATTARLWRVDLNASVPDTAKTVAAKVEQSSDEGPTDVDAAARGNLGAWESSGVVDASAVFGPGSFLVTVQAHTLWIEKQIVAPANDPGPLKRGFTYKREGGQLVLLRVRGA